MIAERLPTPFPRRTPREWATYIDALAAKDIDAAIQACRDAIAAYPGKPFAYSTAGNLLDHLGREAEAEEMLVRAVELAPGDWKSLSRLVRLKARQGDQVATTALYRRLLRAGGRAVETLDGFVEFLIGDGDHRSAVEVAAEAFAEKPSAPRRRLHALALELLARDADRGIGPAAKSAFRRAARRMLQERWADAARRLERVVARAPAFAAAWASLRAARLLEGSAEKADAVLGRWRAARPADGALIDAVAALPVSRRGLLFDPRTPLRIRPLDRLFARVGSVAALRATPDSYCLLEAGGERLRLDPVVQLSEACVAPFEAGYVTAAQFVVRIDHPLLVGRGTVIGPGGTLVEEHHAVHPAQKHLAERDGEAWRFDPGLFRDGRGETRFHDRPAVVFCGPSDASFGDWIFSYVPRLLLTRDLGEDLDVVVRDDAYPQFVDMLLALGVRKERLRRHAPHGVSVFPTLYLTSWPGGVNTPMRGFDRVYEPLRKASSAWDGRRIYLSRRGVADRPLVNEAEVEALFASKGFEIVRPERLSFEQALEVFAAPSVVAGPYGSAFHNLVFSRTKPVSLALAGPHTRKLYAEFAGWFGLLDLPLGLLEGQPTGGGASPRALPWAVSLEALGPAIDGAIALAAERER